MHLSGFDWWSSIHSLLLLLLSLSSSNWTESTVFCAALCPAVRNAMRLAAHRCTQCEQQHRRRWHNFPTPDRWQRRQMDKASDRSKDRPLNTNERAQVVTAVAARHRCHRHRRCCRRGASRASPDPKQQLPPLDVVEYFTGGDGGNSSSRKTGQAAPNAEAPQKSTRWAGYGKKKCISTLDTHIAPSPTPWSTTQLLCRFCWICRCVCYTSVTSDRELLLLSLCFFIFFHFYNWSFGLRSGRCFVAVLLLPVALSVFPRPTYPASNLASFFCAASASIVTPYRMPRSVLSANMAAHADSRCK